MASFRRVLSCGRILPSISSHLFVCRYASCVKAKKLVFREYGDPLNVVKLEEDTLCPPGPGEVLVEMLIASVNPADVNLIQGAYPIKPKLPSVPGNEGVGQVLEVGSDVNDLEVGDRVIPNSDNLGTWRTHSIFHENALLKVPKDVPLVEIAGITSNPSTAYRMLKDFVPLEKGDVVLQNGANSAAGQNVIQLCKARCLKSVNIVRNRPDIEKLREYLINLGANYVLTEEELRTTNLFKSVLAAPKLVLNCVGGKSTIELMRKLAPGGVMVTYGGMSREPVIVPTSLLIFKDIQVKGFWMTRWSRENKNSKERKVMLSELMELMKRKELVAPNHSLLPLSRFSEALTNTNKPGGFVNTKYMIDFKQS